MMFVIGFTIGVIGFGLRFFFGRERERPWSPNGFDSVAAILVGVGAALMTVSLCILAWRYLP